MSHTERQRYQPLGELHGLTGYEPLVCITPGCNTMWNAAKPGGIGPDGLQQVCRGCHRLFVVSYPATGLVIREVIEARR